MSEYGEERASVYHEAVRKARKSHTCGACGDVIRISDEYVRVAIVFEGSASAVKRCLRCQAIHKHLRTKCATEGDMWPREGLDCGKDYEEEWGEAPPPEIAALAFALPDDLQRKAAL